MTKVEDLRATTIAFANENGLLEEHVDRIIAAVTQAERRRCQELAKDVNCGAMFMQGCPLFVEPTTQRMTVEGFLKSINDTRPDKDADNDR